VRLVILKTGKTARKLKDVSKILTVNTNSSCTAKTCILFILLQFYTLNFNQWPCTKSRFMSDVLNFPRDNVCNYGKRNKTTVREHCGNDLCRDAEYPSELSPFRLEL
jgi:hypothetical protein